ncbi:ABC transporter ATP-binding protein [Aureibacter tunicatorum]|uniref:ABC-2 type transport system ATP-binding protein n=1 Tax=Aureibacter tunicatorum TaxID=866807 RepID=A0AAE3XIT2_9BACT|nr:ABC transporter ATP-binding protein [Aureibacter tunicatorum]MDR6237617.1 ABC-2 type transport system ATP-binding protein [Aureibacter tunicatorum]BDD02652.1 ABC transporter ATP-binding protein [Aureibacter tunicatorum]
MEILTVTNLSKSFGKVKAVQNLSFSVPKGSIMGILGPNGSGKSTTLGILLNVTHGYQGSFSWNLNKENSNARQNIGALLETPNFYPYLTGAKNLEIVAEIKGASSSDIKTALEFTGMKEHAKRKYQNYSLGMKQRLAIASAMLGDPEVMILDEPTNGLDPEGIAEIRQMIIELGDKGKTILLASHLLDEVEKVCSHLIVLDKGEKLYEGPINALTTSDTIVEINADNPEKLKSLLEDFNGIKSIKKESGKFIVQLGDRSYLKDLSKHLNDQELTITHFSEVKKSLEEEFLNIIKRHKS